MSKKEELFAFQVARVRAKENTLLSDAALDSLMACATYEECIQILLDRGWGPTAHDTQEELLSAEHERLWQFMGELLSDAQMKFFDIFRYGNDFHNLKAAIKESYVQKETPGVYMEDGTIPVARIRSLAQEGEFMHLPASMAGCAARARDILFQTGDSQLCDVIIDKAALEAAYKAGKAAGNDLLKEYAELKCAAADINIAIRACKAHKGAEFLKEAFAECDSISAQRLTNATLNGMDAIYEYLENSPYSDAVDAIKESPAAFDRWCDNRIMKLIKPQKYNAFTISPLVAYVLAKESEIKSVRIILSGKLNGLPEEKVRERVRDSYV